MKSGLMGRAMHSQTHRHCLHVRLLRGHSCAGGRAIVECWLDLAAAIHTSTRACHNLNKVVLARATLGASRV